MAGYSTKMFEGEYVDPSLRDAVTNIANSTLAMETDPELALQKGQLKIEKPAEYSYGSSLNEAVMKRARDKFYDPTLAEGSQKFRYVMNTANNIQNAANNVLSIYKLDKEAERIARERKAAEDAQRSQVLSSVLGLGGAVIGGVVAGPAGAVVGSQVGSSIGGKNSQVQGRSPYST